jgi:hypothetical protein
MALPQMTPQQYADLLLSIWQGLRDLPPEERTAILEKILEALAVNHERQ